MLRPLARRLAALAVLLYMSAALASPAAAAPLANRAPTDDVFYQIMPIAWRDSNNDAQRFGDFGGMTASLPYLKSLGVTAIWMTPIFPSNAYHGYQHGPANQLNPWFGNEAQFLSFVAAAHAESIKVFIDFVAYHVSQNSIYFTDSYLNNASVYTDYLAYSNPRAGNSLFDGGSYTTWNGSTVGQIKWNLTNPAPTALLESWTAHWLDPNGDGNPSDGIDGYRLDHVLLDEGWGYNLGWWQHWKGAMQAVNPDVFTFAEQADWGSHGQDLLSAHDATFTKPFLFAARSAINAGLAAGLYNEMAATLASLPPGRTYLGSLGDHDVDRLASNLANNTSRAKAAAAVLMLQPFPPVIYYGDELGMRGTKANFGSDNNDIPMREPFKWNAVAGAPMSNYHVLNALAFNNRVARDNDGRSVQEQSGVPGSLLETYRTLGQLRRGHAALRHGRYDAIPNSSAATWAFARTAANEETLIVAINLSGAGSSVNAGLDLSAFALSGTVPVRDVVSGATLTPLTAANQSNYVVNVPGSGYRILSARVAAPAAPPPSPYNGAAITSDFAPTTLLATQTTRNSGSDNLMELDQMFARQESDALALGITGNLPNDGTAIALFFDTKAGGQDSLSTATLPQPPSGLPQASGLGFDAGFAPDWCLWVNGFGGNLYLDLYTLATGGGGSKRYLGSGLTGNGQPYLSGGDNPNGLLAAFDNANTQGITLSSAASASTATRGLELRIPWADLGLTGPTPGVKLFAAIIRPDGTLWNQFLPGIGDPQAPLGATPRTFKTIAGTQYVTLPAVTGVEPRGDMPSLMLASAPNPFRDRTRIACTLPVAGALQVEVLDVSGRRIRTLASGPHAAGTHTLQWDGRDLAGAPVRAGLYLVRATSTGSTRSLRVVRVQ